MNECLEIPRIAGAKDTRAKSCMAAACQDTEECRSQYRVCGTGLSYCSQQQGATWIPECSDDLSLGTAVTPFEPQDECSGTYCEDTTHCRNQAGDCSLANCDLVTDENPNSIWTSACPVVLEELDTCSGEACANPDHCRRSSDDTCGEGWEFCTADSTWNNLCSTAPTTSPTPNEDVEVPTSSPTDSPAEIITTSAPTSTQTLKCFGNPCTEENECRNKDRECGKGDNFCNPASIWSPSCTLSTRDNNNGASSTMQLANAVILASAVALLGLA